MKNIKNKKWKINTVIQAKWKTPSIFFFFFFAQLTFVPHMKCSPGQAFTIFPAQTEFPYKTCCQVLYIPHLSINPHSLFQCRSENKQNAYVSLQTGCQKVETLLSIPAMIHFLSCRTVSFISKFGICNIRALHYKRRCLLP